MRKNLAIFFLPILALGCSNVNFSNTETLLETDKETYLPNDVFEITVLIYPTEEKKTIKFKKDLNNLNLSFESPERAHGFHQELKKRFIEGPSLFGDDSEYIDEYTITKDKPFKKTLRGTIFELENNIIFEVPELNISDKIDKLVLQKNPTIAITGHCRAVYRTDEKPFPTKEIKILIE